MAEGFIPSHGGYKKLLSYPKAEIVYDATVRFCDRFIEQRSRTRDQKEGGLRERMTLTRIEARNRRRP